MLECSVQHAQNTFLCSLNCKIWPIPSLGFGSSDVTFNLQLLIIINYFFGVPYQFSLCLWKQVCSQCKHFIFPKIIFPMNYKMLQDNVCMRTEGNIEQTKSTNQTNFITYITFATLLQYPVFLYCMFKKNGGTSVFVSSLRTTFRLLHIDLIVYEKVNELSFISEWQKDLCQTLKLLF